MSDEQKWLDLALVYSKLSGKFWARGDYNRYRLALAESNDCFDKYEVRVVC